MMRLVALHLLGCCLYFACCAEDAGQKGKWISISDGLLEKLAKDNIKVGYPGMTSGITVDRTSGDVYMVVCDQGLWKSTDKGSTFERADDKSIGGRCETGFALDFDPNGKRLMCFMIYGSAGWTPDAGKTWHKSKLAHLDFGATDWTDTDPRLMLAVKHESGDELVLTTDGAASWKSLGKGFKSVGLFGADAFVASKGRGKGIVRSADGGQTWTEVSPSTPVGLTMRVFNGIGYWISSEGVLISKDRGQTWSTMGKSVKAFYGPYFGENDQHMVVVGKEGVQETKDGGMSWKVAAPLPQGFTPGFTGPNFGWDPKADIFYASSMGKPAFKFQR